MSIDIPTSVTWDHNDVGIISGYVYSNNLVHFDRENVINIFFSIFSFFFLFLFINF